MRPGFCCTLVAALCLLMDALPCAAQVSFHTGVNRDTITVGGPITFRVRVRRGAEDRVEILPEGGFPGPFEIRHQPAPRVREMGEGRVEETRDYVITAYRTGEFELPPLTLRFQTASGDTGRIASDAVPIVVQSVVTEDISDIRDVKPPVEMPSRIPLWVWIAGAALAVAGAVWYVKYRRRRVREEPPLPPVDWPAEVAKIARMGLLEKGDYRRYYTLLSEATRRYLEARACVDAMERTTFEIAAGLREQSVGEAHVAEVEGFLSEADLVKFAKVRPPEETAARAVQRVLDLMAHIDAERKARPEEADREMVPAGNAR